MILFFALGLLLLFVLIAAAKWYVSVGPQQIFTVVKWGLLCVAMVGVAWLAFSGRLIVALAALPAVLAWLVRLYSGLRNAQMFSRMFKGQKGAQNGSSSGQSSGQYQSSTHMSREEAFKILGLHPGASPEEIKVRHRRMMSKVHPDVGGSDYLAQQINRAKDLLLG